MKFEGEHTIAASREDVFAALNNPDVLRRSIPGCEELEKLSDTEMEATVVAKVGPVKAKFKGGCTLSDIVAPESYVLIGEGKGAASMGKCRAYVTLEESGNNTILCYQFSAEVSGKLAQIGSRLVESSTKKLANDFFHTFAQCVLGGEPVVEEMTAENKASAGGISMYWKVAGLSVAALMAYFFVVRA